MKQNFYPNIVISDLCNLSITFKLFSDSCKVATLKSLYKKDSLTLRSNYRRIFQKKKKKKYAIGLSKPAINWFKSYLSKSSFLVNLGISFAQPTFVTCNVPKVLFCGNSCL